MQKVNIDTPEFAGDHAASDLVTFLDDNESTLLLTDAVLYYDFPIYRDDAGDLVTAKVLIVSPHHGFIVIAPTDAAKRTALADLVTADTQLDSAFSCLYSRLLRNRVLRSTKTTIKVPDQAFIYAPFLDHLPAHGDLATPVVTTHAGLQTAFAPLAADPLQPELLAELLSTVEGAKGLIRPKARHIDATTPKSKGRIVADIESAIASFDLRQKEAYVASPSGVERIRGLAGSGKTVILAMKAALTHLRYPDKTILYTFSTRSLYQYIQRLITRFYRQFHEQDPDWDRVKILHAWGGSMTPGVYSIACEAHGVTPLTFGDARVRAASDSFDYVCQQLTNSAKLQPMYDFVFLDEGQDFPASFVRLCAQLSRDNRVVWAYDDLQTIFRAMIPTAAQVFGTDEAGHPVMSFARDLVLYKCYRNPRELLVCAHAFGFGIYGTRIVQMLENAQHWEDLGYRVTAGDFTEGSQIEIERPAANSLALTSEHYSRGEIVSVRVFTDMDQEVKYVAGAIKADLEEGLRPDDILVITVDDRNAKAYLQRIALALGQLGVRANDIHNDAIGLVDFFAEDKVTLSTVHKAKGNEAFMVYVVGIDALSRPYPSVRERNMLFTAMTRAKAWARLTGVGEAAESCKSEIAQALENFPYLRFTFPSAQQLKIMRRDLGDDAARKQQANRLMERLVDEYGVSPEELELFLKDRKDRGARRRKKL